MATTDNGRGINGFAYTVLAAAIMAYGWRYRGSVGHEAGAMVPGALLGLVVALASGRSDWQRRTVAAGLFAVGISWWESWQPSRLSMGSTGITGVTEPWSQVLPLESKHLSLCFLPGSNRRVKASICNRLQFL